MDQMILLDKNLSEFNNVKGMAQRNVAEKVMHDKLQRQIDSQKKAFVKQHTKDEKEVKVILQRLQLEQQILDAGVDDLSDEEKMIENSPETSEDEGIVNPYPVMILPKFGTTPQKETGLKGPINSQRKKSLEYEDVDKMKRVASGMRTTLIATSFISKLRSPFQKRTTEKHNEQDENWSEQWETTASIRRPRKTVAEQNQHRLLQRAKTEILSRPSSSLSSSITSLFSPRRNCSSRYSSKKDDTLNLNELQFEGTVEDPTLSTKSSGVSKSRRGGSLKEKKVVANEENTLRMRRANSTKEGRKSYSVRVQNEDVGKSEVDKSKPISRKNSKENKVLKAGNVHDTISRKGSTESDATRSPNMDGHTDSSKKHLSDKNKHTRQGSLKERGELRSSKSVKMKRVSSLRKVSDSAADEKIMKTHASLSTDSSPVDSPKTSPMTKDSHFKFSFKM